MVFLDVLIDPSNFKCQKFFFSNTKCLLYFCLKLIKSETTYFCRGLGQYLSSSTLFNADCQLKFFLLQKSFEAPSPPKKEKQYLVNKRFVKDHVQQLRFFNTLYSAQSNNIKVCIKWTNRNQTIHKILVS